MQQKIRTFLQTRKTLDKFFLNFLVISCLLAVYETFDIKLLTLRICCHNSPFEKNPKEAFQKQVTQGHQKIDEVFQTHYADLYSDEARGADAEITTGILPFPGAAIGKTAATSLLAEQEMSHILKEVNQIKTTYPHLKTDKVISGVCNRSNLKIIVIIGRNLEAMYLS